MGFPDVAIEPITCLLQHNANLRGFEIPNAPELVIINLFADNTVIYLREKDNFENLQSTLD
jgi:hypothetical protein